MSRISKEEKESKVIKKSFDFKKLNPLRNTKSITISVTKEDWGENSSFLIDKIFVRAALGGGKEMSKEGKISLCLWSDGTKQHKAKSILSTKNIVKFLTFFSIIQKDFIVVTGDYPIYIKEKEIDFKIKSDETIFIELINSTGRVIQKSWETDVIEIFLLGEIIN